METHSPKGVTMGLFTNRKREVADDDVQPPRILGGEESSWIEDPPAPLAPNQGTDEGLSPTNDITDWFGGVTTDVVPERAEPFAEGERRVGSTEPAHEAERALAEFGITLAETEPAVPPAPRRPLTERPVHAGNVEIDVDGLLEMLGVAPNAPLIDISEAHLRFMAQHDPAAEDDPEAAHLKEQIRRQVNTAYASFRLTLAD